MTATISEIIKYIITDDVPDIVIYNYMYIVMPLGGHL